MDWVHHRVQDPKNRGTWDSSRQYTFPRHAVSLCCSIAKSCLTLCNSMRCSTPGFSPSLSPRVCSNSCPLSQCCHPTVSSSVVRFSSCLQSFPTSGSFPMSQLFASGGQTIGASASASVLQVLLLCLLTFFTIFPTPALCLWESLINSLCLWAYCFLFRFYM